MKCKFIKNNGNQCEANTISNSQFCFWHDPDIDPEERRKARVDGGKANKIILKNPLPELIVKKPEDVILLLTDTINRVRSGEIDIKLANCLGVLSSCLIKAFETTQIEGRVEIIERAILEKRTTYNS